MRYSHIYKIKNKDKYVSADSTYFLIKTKHQSYLFTYHDLESAKYRANRNKEDTYPDKIFHDQDIIGLIWALVVGIIIGIAII